jgi:hypothetical protein
MKNRLPILIIAFIMLFAACDQEKETPNLELGLEYQPLGLGFFWIYEVEETIFFGENDSETSKFFFRDRIRTSYLNAQNEVTYIIERSMSIDRQNWMVELEYTMINRDNILLRTINNRPVVALVFPPETGKVWNGKVYQAEGNDDFEIEGVSQVMIPGRERIDAVRVNQENLDDKITKRDIRYEIFGKGVGSVEQYSDVITYCSRNDCLGRQLINGGRKIHLKLIEYDAN